MISYFKAGDLNERITFCDESTVKTGVGKKKEYVDGATVWANIRYVSDKEKYRANILGSSVDIRVVIRNRAVSSHTRIKYKNSLYEITAQRPLDSQFLELTLGSIAI